MRCKVDNGIHGESLHAVFDVLASADVAEDEVKVWPVLQTPDVVDAPGILQIIDHDDVVISRVCECEVPCEPRCSWISSVPFLRSFFTTNDGKDVCMNDKCEPAYMKPAPSESKLEFFDFYSGDRCA